MSMRLKDGDYIPDGSGSFCKLADKEALLERVLFRLAARRGAFPFLPQLGSRLYRLAQEKTSRRAALAKQYVEEALAEEAGLSVQDVEWREESGALIAHLSWREEQFSLLYAPESLGGIV